ncbi:MAG: chromosome segregation protein SMC [Solirubrobacterales bacterium]
MYLRQLELKGFKSFADNTQIPFHQGLNIIVGPNGCGKSNIVDAIRWVLGESNVRNLRGQKAEDVIFTGTDTKRPLGFASASMTIDNEDGSLQTDFSEVTVTRKVHRSGDSEFMINRSDVRLKDIHALFAGTGLGKKGYSIIGQGELEQILNAKPYERRLILEEAAGLSVYRQKKEEAESKLESTAQDMMRVHDILAELDDRLVDLRERAGKAKQHLAWSGELGGLERQVMAYELSLNAEDVAARVREIEAVGLELAGIHEQLASREHVVNERQKALTALTGEIDELKESKFSLNTHHNQIESEIRLLEERLKNASERIGQIGADVVRYEGLIAGLKEDLTRSEAAQAVRMNEYETRLGEEQAASQEAGALRAEMELNAGRIEDGKNRLFELAAAQSAARNRIAENEERLKRHEEKQQRGRSELNYQRERVQVTEDTLVNLTRELEREDAGLEAAAAERETLETEKKNHGLQAAALDREVALLEKSARELENKLLALQQAITQHLGISEPVRRIMEAARKDNNGLQGIVGVLTDLIDVPAGLETAIEAAAGRGLENVVTRTATDSQQAIDLLKQRSWGRVTFLPLDILRPAVIDAAQARQAKTMPGVLGLACELVKYPQEYTKAVHHALGRVLVVETLDQGLAVFRKMPSFRIVTLEGDLINPGGSMSGGRTDKKGPSALGLKAEQKARQSEKAAVDDRLQETAKAKTALSEAMSGLETRMKATSERISEHAFKQNMIRSEIERNRDDRLRMLETAERLEKELTQSTDERQRMENEVKRLAAEAETLNQQTEALNGELRTAQEGADARERRLELLGERLRHLQESLAAQSVEVENGRKSLEQLGSVRQSYEEALNTGRTERVRLQQLIETETARCKELRLQLVESERDLGRVTGLLKVLEDRRVAQEADYQALRDEIEPVRENIARLEERQRNVELRKVKAETEMNGALFYWREKFGDEDYQPHLVGLELKQQREMRRRAESLRGQLETLGPVDLGSIEELDAVQTRHDFLTSQLSDLKAAREALFKLIRETETAMNTRFDDFLKLADTSFRGTFTNIFHGGEAELVKDHHVDNPWLSGVEIMVKMPGKRRQSLNLLSGGERALTCIAFIFSLLLLKPAPFCLLDEIDAALDEVNLTRFTDFLRRLSGQIQFIVITHRQTTIEAGDVIYGVTMPEQGISDVLSVSVNEAQSLAG